MTIAEAVDTAFSIGMYQHRDEIEPFAEWLAERRPHHVLEIGAWKGGTAALWGAIATGTVVSIDLPNGPWGGADAGLDREACERRNHLLREINPRFVGIIGDSQDRRTQQIAASELRGPYADLVFIDGDHSWEGVWRDYEAYGRLASPGGAIAFHDVIECERHTRDGVEVPRFWRELTGKKLEFIGKGGNFGGIGVLIA